MGTLEEKKARLSDPKIRQAMREEYETSTKASDFIFGDLPQYIARKVRGEGLKERV